MGTVSPTGRASHPPQSAASTSSEAGMRDLDTDPDDAAIVSAIIALAHSLKLKVVAEGVETEAQLAFLRSHYCDEYQGFLTSRALEASAFMALVKSRLPAELVLAAD